MIQELLKLIFKGIKALFRLISNKREIKQEPVDYQDDQPKIRIQFEDFTLDKFDIAPIWEFALDEEGVDGQDETTLRPCVGLSIADPSNGLCIIKAEFKANNGQKFHGICSPSFEQDLSTIQPYIIDSKVGLFPFWFGIAEPDQVVIGNFYKDLEVNKNSFFPLKYIGLTPSKGAKLQGNIDGFMWRTIENEDKLIKK